MALPAAAAATTLGGMAADIGASKLFTIAGDIIDGVSAAKDFTNPSLTRYLRNTMLISRVYIDGTIGFDPVVPDILRSAHTLYTSLILNALQLDQLVENGRSVKELLKTVATEHYQAEHIATADRFGLYCGLEAQYGSPSAGHKPTHGGHAPAETTVPEVDPKTARFFGGKLVKQDETGHLPYGRMIEVEFKHSSAAKDAAVKINLLVQMVPYMINPTIATEFVKLNSKVGFLKRWTMWRAGEIAFWKDLVFAMDIYTQKKAVLKNDVNGTLRDYLNEQIRKDAQSANNVWQALAKQSKTPENRNIANAVMVFSEETVQRTKAATGFDLHYTGDRNAYFRETYAMLIYVVDPMYNTVKLYMNGIRGVGEYTFDAFKSKGKANDVVNLMAALAAMNQGQAPRF